MFISSNAISNTKHEQSQAPWIFETPRSGLFPKLLWSQIDSHQYSVRIPPSLIVCFRSGLLWQYSGARPSLGWTTRTTSASSPSSVSSPGSISSVWLLSSRWGRSLFHINMCCHTLQYHFTHIPPFSSGTTPSWRSESPWRRESKWLFPVVQLHHSLPPHMMRWQGLISNCLSR